MNTRSYTFFIGIDISKAWFNANLSNNDISENITHRRFDNHKTDFEVLLK